MRKSEPAAVGAPRYNRDTRRHAGVEKNLRIAPFGAFEMLGRLSEFRYVEVLEQPEQSASTTLLLSVITE